MLHLHCNNCDTTCHIDVEEPEGSEPAQVDGQEVYFCPMCGEPADEVEA